MHLSVCSLISFSVAYGFGLALPSTLFFGLLSRRSLVFVSAAYSPRNIITSLCLYFFFLLYVLNIYPSLSACALVSLCLSCLSHLFHVSLFPPLFQWSSDAIPEPARFRLCAYAGIFAGKDVASFTARCAMAREEEEKERSRKKR